MTSLLLLLLFPLLLLSFAEGAPTALPDRIQSAVSDLWHYLVVGGRLETNEVQNHSERRAKIHAYLTQLRGKLRDVVNEHDPRLTEQLLKDVRDHVRESIKSRGDSIHEINSQRNKESEPLFQLDVKISEKQLDTLPGIRKRLRRQAYRDIFYPSTLWRNGLFYEFDADFSAHGRDAARRAITLWQTQTCIDFHESSTNPDRVKIYAGDGCFSYVGRVGGVQELSLGSGCETIGTAAHELAHTLGFFHLMARFDRDQYIAINVANVVPGYEDNFLRESPATNDNYGAPFDYGSVMQYGGSSASRNRRPTIVARDTAYQDTMGSEVVSFFDLFVMNAHYGCHSRCFNVTLPPCYAGGFRNPRNCTRCVCPDGYDGERCERALGQQLIAGDLHAMLNSSVGTGLKVEKLQFDRTHFTIYAPPGRNVEIVISSLSSICIEGCPYGGVELKTRADKRLTGYRFCCESDASRVLTSEDRQVPVIVSNRYRHTTVSLLYRFV